MIGVFKATDGSESWSSVNSTLDVVVGTVPSTGDAGTRVLESAQQNGVLQVNGDRWQQVDRIFHDVLSCEPSQRASFLEGACAGDSSLRKEVEILIGSYEAAGSFLNSPALRVIASSIAPPSGSLAGSVFGPYELKALLGAGGMGEVYRARDSKLKRDIAIKVLPQEFCRDADRVARFQREAEVLASLNHPHIAAIYDLAEFGDSRFLVLELIEGQTLADRIARGPLPVGDSLVIARQVAEAIEAAHEISVLHRDLKPANIMVTPGGQVKVLDFGLAKVAEDKFAKTNLSRSPTIMSGTLGGTILGTAAYMSPEQARGEKADRTSDVWAFGCVLYEMLTGRQAFGGRTATDILGSILKSEPDWNALPQRTPARIRKLLARCLQKERRHRLHDIADARIEIEDASGDHETVAPPRRIWLRPLPIVLTVLALAGTFAGGWYLRNPREEPEVRVEVNTPPTTNLGAFAVSPDGRKLAFVATFEGHPRLFLRSLDLNTAEPLPGTEGASNPFWSPNGQSIGFVSGFFLKRIDIAGRAVQIVMGLQPGRPPIVDALSATWNENGVIVFGPNVNTPLYRVSESGGQSVLATHLDPPRQMVHFSPKFLPDGQHFLLYAQGNSEGRGVYVGSLQSPEVRRLFDADGPAVFLPPGYLLYLSQGALLARRFDTRTLERAGNPVTVAPQANFVSASVNVVAYRTEAPRMLTWFDRSGKPTGTIGQESGATPEISPDGKWVAVIRTSADGNIDVWVLDSTRGVSNRLTVDPAVEGFPIWSPDSKRIVFTSDKGHPGTVDFYRKTADSYGEATLFMAPGLGQPTGWSADGRYFLFQRRDSNNLVSLHALALTVGGKPAGQAFALTNNTNANDTFARFSPDGRWIAYQSNRSGKYEIYVQPFPGPGTAQQISIGGGSQVRWPRNAKELFYVGPDGKLITVPVAAAADGRTIDLGRPAVIAPNLRVEPSIRQNYDVSADGQRILMSAAPEDQLTPPISLILNWHPKP